MHKPHHLTRYTDEPRESHESTDPRRWKALAVLSLAQLMLILDLTVVNVALPNLGADLDLSRTAFTWAVSAYTLFFGGLMLLGGRFADVFGSRPVMLTGPVIFTLASLASGLAQNETLLIGGRIGTRPVAVVGLILVAIGNALLIGLSADGNVYVEALPGVVMFALGGGPLFVCATTSALARAGQHEAGVVSGVVYTFHELGAAIFVALASTVAAAGLIRTPSIDGFTNAFTLFTIAAAVAAVLSLRLVPSGK